MHKEGGIIPCCVNEEEFIVIAVRRFVSRRAAVKDREE
jgi:hypothetical protein